MGLPPVPSSSDDVILRRESPPGDLEEDNRVTQLYVVTAVFPALATIAVLLRFYSRKLKGLSWWWDDWIAAVGLLWAWAFYGCTVASIHNGNGLHVQFVSAENQTRAIFWLYCYQIFYVLLPPTVKLSALFLYKRIFVSKRFALLVNVMIVTVACWGLASVLISVFECIPIRSFWERTPGRQCINLYTWILAFGISNILLDLVVWGMPIPRIWLMNLPRHQKIILTLIFLFGLVDCVFAAIRLSGAVRFIAGEDFTYKWAPTTWWSMIHTCLGIVVISLPTMRILLTKLNSLISGGTAGFSKHHDNHDNHHHHHHHNRGNDGFGNNGFDGFASFDTQDHPPKVTRYQIRSIGLSFSGENERSVHNNTIALALRQGSDATALSESDMNIHVKRRFSMDSQRMELGKELGKELVD